MRKSKYLIRFGSLPVGIHDFEFEVMGTFFQEFEESGIEVADVKVEARLTKQNNLLQLDLWLHGTVGIDCDRCLKSFQYPIEAREHLVIKHGNPEESTDEILVLDEGIDHIDLAHHLYEFVTLAMPARKVPCEMDEDVFRCDYETLKKLEEISVEPDDDQEEKKEEEKNSIWEELNKIKYNKN
jgi:uncharacterized protein